MTEAAPAAKVLCRLIAQSWNGVCSCRRKCPANSACTTARVGLVRADRPGEGVDLPGVGVDLPDEGVDLPGVGRVASSSAGRGSVSTPSRHASRTGRGGGSGCGCR